jgi:hypothetical protein
MEENGGYKLYRIDPSILEVSFYGPGVYPYFLDSTSGTTGHPISKETYEAIQFLKNKETSNVLGWWDYELEIKASSKEPIISYASKDIIQTIGRPSFLYDKFDTHEKVVDVSKFFATDSEEVAKSTAEKYGANFVYISRQKWQDLFFVMYSMAYKFNSAINLKYFEKVFENKDVIIYELK